ncbi:hypothetical protein [Glaciihabitans sp. dw_435]|uniref:hypothetical protein n=1 Tax=Glaciihabitans sp. dw_435 TaxID=2720081 RepID=UPI001BD6BF98|nr:hypothetical protein [Glaciihabitans sp. dw_435]
MTRFRTRTLIPLTLGLAVLTLPLLAGCANNPVTGFVRDVTGGTVDVGGTSVPQDFPSAVPLFDGTVVSGSGVGGEGAKVWNVSVRVPTVDSVNDIASALTAAGFSNKFQGSATPDAATLVSDAPAYSVVVNVVQDDGGFVANYTVTKK